MTRMEQHEHSSRKHGRVTPTGTGDVRTAPFEGRLALRIPEAAAAIGVGKSTLYALIAEKKLQTALIAGRRVVPVSELERLLRESIVP